MNARFAASSRVAHELLLQKASTVGCLSNRLWNQNQCENLSTCVATRFNGASPRFSLPRRRPFLCRIFLLKSSRGFIRLPKSFINAAAGGGKRRDYSETRMLGYSDEQMYDIVRQVTLYPEFVPWCTAARMRHRGGDDIEGSDIAVMEVGFPPISERYTSIVTYAKPHLVQSVANDGRMFKYMFTQWKFAPGQQPQSCVVDFSISFEFKNVLHSSVANLFFEEVARKMVGAFLSRANDQYGPPSLVDQRVMYHSEKS